MRKQKTIVWNDTLEKQLETIAKHYGDELRAAGILPYTKTTHTGTLKANASAIVAFCVNHVAQLAREKDEDLTS